MAASKTDYLEFLQALEFSRLGYWRWDPATDIVSLSPRAGEIFGLADLCLPWEEMRGLLLEPEREEVRAAVDRAIETKQDYEVAYRIKRPSDGEIRWILARGRALYIDEAVAGMVGVVEDITRRRGREAALAEERKSLEILNQTGTMIGSALDLDTMVQAVTDAAVALTHAAFGAFFYNITNASGKSYMLYTLSGAPRSAFEKFPMPRNTEVFAATFEGKGIVRSDDILKDPRYGKSEPYRGMPEGHLPVRSYLAVPVVSRSGEVIGGLFFGHPEVGVFDARAEALAAGIAAQAAVAIDNSRLLKIAQEERERYRTLVDMLPQLIWTCDPNGDCTHLSRQWVDYTGVPAEAQLGLKWLETAIHPDDRGRIYEHWMGAVRGDHGYDIEFRIRRRDGIYRWFKTRAEPIRHGDYMVQWFGTCTDIQDIVTARDLQASLSEQLENEVIRRTAELQQANALLRQESLERQSVEGKFKLLVESVVDYALFMLDTEGRVTNWNQGAEVIKGYKAHEIVGRHFSVFYTPEDREAGLPGAGLRAAAEKGKHEMEGLRLRKDGTAFWASIVINAVRDPSGQLVGFAKITRDISERRRAEQALKAAQEQLAQAQKMEGIGQLTGGVAHDFNNLLTIILGNLDTVRRGLASQSPADARLARATENAIQGAQRAASLTQRLLAFSRRQPLDPKPVDVGRLVTGMSDLLHRSLGEQISVETVLAGGLWRAHVDANQLEIALLNLAVNARDAMPDGGRLTIETANAFLDEGYTAGQVEVVPGQYVLICVTDTGIGMSREAMARCFEPFFTTKDVGHGTGLGLSQVYGFVKQTGGHVKVYSEPGEGTTVKVYLPRMHGDVVADPPRPRPPTRARGTETVLLVEDEQDVRAYSKEILGELGYTALDAPDGRAALALLAAHPEIRLLFTDVGLPGGMNGRQLADKARALRPDLKILFTTGYARNAIVHDGRLDPGVQLITKPFTFDALADKLRDVLDSRTEARSILLVEDEVMIQLMAVDQLEAAGYKVEVAMTASEALDKVRLVRGVDLAIVDVGLPDRKGDVLVGELRALYPELPVIIASGYDDGVLRESLKGAPRLAFLGKPYREEDLLAAVRALLPDPPEPEAP